MYPCDQCTKNFLTAESLKSHQQRKHSVIEEKHELSDDNEKGDFEIGKMPTSEDDENLNQLTTTVTVPEETGLSEQGDSKFNNNNESEASKNCDACCQKKEVNSSSVAIQCDVAIIDTKEVSTIQTMINEENDGEWRKL